MSQHRELYFKIERLDYQDFVVDDKSLQLNSGDVRVAYDAINRRTCSFELTEALPADWMRYRWKPYYGQKINGVIEYTSLGVFIPVNPDETEVSSGYITKLQGVDKAVLLSEAYSDIPLTFTTGTTLKEVATEIFGMVSETKLNLDDVPYALATDFTFEEGISLEHILSTLVRSFPADWYYDRDGYAILEQLPPADQRPVVYDLVEGDASIYVRSSRSIDTDQYWNKVTVVGGTVDTGIFRQTYYNDIEYQKAGRWVTRFFKEDVATSQEQVNDLAAQFLDAGSRLPVNISIHSLPLADLEPKQIVTKSGVKYEIIDFNIPLNLDLQQIRAGEVL